MPFALCACDGIQSLPSKRCREQNLPIIDFAN